MFARISRRASVLINRRCLNNLCQIANRNVHKGIANQSNVPAPQNCRYPNDLSSENQNENLSNLENYPTVDYMVQSIYCHVANTNPHDFTDQDMSEKVLKPRTFKDSYRRFIIPLSTDKQKRKEYISANGNVRSGKILEDLDHMAVHVAYIHNSESGSLEGAMSLPRTIVTASVHRIDFNRSELKSDRDILIDGQVTFTGSSSMQTSIRLFQHDDNNNLSLMLKAQFLMVARNPLDTKKKVRIHQLLLRTPDEAEMFNTTKERIKFGSKDNHRSPKNEELRLIHENYQTLITRNPLNETPVLNNSEMWLHRTGISVTEICFPEYQNMYGKIFGGFLMRKALELASTNGKLFCKGRVLLRSMDHIEFGRPVEIGNILHLDSLVTYTRDNFLQVKVLAATSDEKALPKLAAKNLPTLGQEERTKTNEFNFTLESIENKNILTIVPKHYVHASSYLEGRRLLNNTLHRLVD